jgi:hypothetical protein
MPGFDSGSKKLKKNITDRSIIYLHNMLPYKLMMTTLSISSTNPCLRDGSSTATEAQGNILFINVPKDVFFYIISQGDIGLVGMLTTVCNAWKTYVKTYFPIKMYTLYHTYIYVNCLEDYGVTHGYLNIIQWRVGKSTSVKKIARRYLGYKPMYDCCNTSQLLWEVRNLATINGHFEMLKWACAEDPNLLESSFIEATCHEAVRHNYLEIVQWAYERSDQSPKLIDSIAYAAAVSDSLDVFVWIFGIIKVVSYDTTIPDCLSVAHRCGNIKIIQFIEGAGYKLNKSIGGINDL